MSQETSEWLNNYCLIGYTDRRGHAWHYRESDQGVEPNHYPGPIPIEDIERRLFNFEAIEAPIFVRDLQTGEHVEISCKKAIQASDNGHVFGIFSDGYTPHQYKEWLIENVASLISESQGDLGIGSAVLLRERGSACVQIEVPDTITTRDGVQFRPWIAAATSLDGSLATIYKRCVTDIVCDNTRDAALGEEGQQFKLKHTRYSNLKIGDARDALEIIFATSDAFQAQVDQLCAAQVTDAQWAAVVKALVPVPEDEGRGQTVAVAKQAKLHTLWTEDDRVTPWKNTAWGVSQAFNTYNQHLATVKGSHRVERSITNALTGKTATADLKVLDVLSQITGKELVSA